MSEGINHNALKLLIEACAVDSATVIANADRWALNITFGGTEKTILAKNSGKARIWRKLDTLAKYLSALGIYSFKTDLTHYDPSKKTLTRPDSAAILKQTHEAHRSQQEKEAIQEPLSMIDKKASPDSVKANWEQRRARILKQENPRVK